MQIEILVKAFEVERDGKVVRYPRSFLKGIFVVEKHVFDERKDKLKWCFAMTGEPQPTDFSAVAGSNHKLIELVRFDEAEAIKIHSDQPGGFKRGFGGRGVGGNF